MALPLPKPSLESSARVLEEHVPALEVEAPAPPFESAARRVLLGTREASCPEHGVFLSEGMRMPRISREFWSRCPACAANERAQQEAEDSAAQTRRKQQALQVAIGQAGVPERFQTRSFENFVADTPEKQRALAVSRRYADTFADSLKSGRGLVFLGQPGTGKSHLAAAILMSMVQRHAVLYTTCMRMIRTVRDTWRRDSERSEREVLNMLSVEVDLLVIDEVGVQYGTDGEKTILFEVLDRRYSELRPTILLTNQDAAGLTEAVGDRIADRLRESSAFVLFQWPSYRGTAARQP